MNPSLWEIWLASVKFEDDPSIVKDRPVLVIDEDHALYISLKMTSNISRANSSEEYLVQEWEQSGLRKPTVIRTSHKLELCRRDFKRKIGNLSLKDILNVCDILNEKKA